MPRYEYRVVPAPSKGVRAKGAKGPAARFSFALQDLMNKMGATGWEYQRAETLPSVERSGLTSSTTEWRNVLVFRRVTAAAIDDFAPVLLPAPDIDVASDVDETEAKDEPLVKAKPLKEDTKEAEQSAIAPETFSDESAEKGPGAIRMLRDNGVEDVSDVSGVTNSLKQLVASRKSNKPDT